LEFLRGRAVSEGSDEKRYIDEIFKYSFIETLNQVTGIETLSISDLPEPSDKYCINNGLQLHGGYSVFLISKGRFRSYIVCYMDNDTAHSMLQGMNHGREVNGILERPYLRECSNMLFGKVFTEISNHLETRIKFLMPVVNSGMYEGTKNRRYDNYCNYIYRTEKGIIRLFVNYTCAGQTDTGNKGD
jgi:CheY-specific phosphatase CheX